MFAHLSFIIPFTIGALPVAFSSFCQLVIIQFNSQSWLIGNLHTTIHNRNTAISYYLPINTDAEVTLTVTDMGGETIRTLTGSGNRGINRVQWNLRGDPPPQPEEAQQAGPQRGRQREGPLVEPGTYLVTLEVGGMEMTRSILVQEDILEETTQLALHQTLISHIYLHQQQRQVLHLQS